MWQGEEGNYVVLEGDSLWCLQEEHALMFQLEGAEKMKRKQKVHEGVSVRAHIASVKVGATSVVLVVVVAVGLRW